MIETNDLYLKFPFVYSFFFFSFLVPYICGDDAVKIAAICQRLSPQHDARSMGTHMGVHEYEKVICAIKGIQVEKPEGQPFL